MLDCIGLAVALDFIGVFESFLAEQLLWLSKTVKRMTSVFSVNAHN